MELTITSVPSGFATAGHFSMSQYALLGHGTKLRGNNAREQGCKAKVSTYLPDVDVQGHIVTGPQLIDYLHASLS